MCGFVDGVDVVWRGVCSDGAVCVWGVPSGGGDAVWVCSGCGDRVVCHHRVVLSRACLRSVLMAAPAGLGVLGAVECLVRCAFEGWFVGQGVGGVFRVEQFCEALGCSPGWLLGVLEGSEVLWVIGGTVLWGPGFGFVGVVD